MANILLEEGIEPAAEREKKRTWKRFMKSHWDTLYACDFFSVEALKIPAQSPTCNPHAERFVNTIKYECLNHFILFGERHLRHLIKEFIKHDMTLRFHQGIGGELIRNVGPMNDNGADGEVACRSRLGGMLNDYYREAA